MSVKRIERKLSTGKWAAIKLCDGAAVVMTFNSRREAREKRAGYMPTPDELYEYVTLRA